MSDYEKAFIVNWHLFRPSYVSICWNTIAYDLEKNCGTRHAINKIRKFWYSNRKYYADKLAEEERKNYFNNVLEPQVLLEPKFNHPHKMQPLF